MREAELGKRVLKDGRVFELVDELKQLMVGHAIPHPDVKTAETFDTNTMINQRIDKYVSKEIFYDAEEPKAHITWLQKIWHGFGKS